MKSNRKSEYQEAILWNMRCLRSSFGKQPFTHKCTEPNTCIGTAGRGDYSRLYLSAEHCKVTPGNNSVGAVYRTYGAFGPQWESVRPSSAMPIIGSSQRSNKDGNGKVPGPGIYKAEGSLGPQRSARRATSARAVIGSETRAGRNNRFMDEELEKTICGRDTPAPVAYEVQERLGKTPLSTKRSSPQARMGTARRFGEGGGAQRGGAEMAYDAAVSALGRQLQSRKKSLPSYGFGTSTRDGVRGVYISKEHGKVLHGVGTPGPATAQGVSAFQGQKMSYKATQPAYRFGSARRLPRHLADTLPGPQTYCA